SPAGLHDAVDAHLAVGDELAGVGPGLGERGELEELAEPDLPLDGHDVLRFHGTDHALSSAGRPPPRPAGRHTINPCSGESTSAPATWPPPPSSTCSRAPRSTSRPPWRRCCPSSTT